jgi:S-adenosylmethionine:tRNA ribosyltransferase-isomerase
MKLSDFDYPLPQDRIAQTPAEPRDSSRLMLLHRQTGALGHRIFRDIADYVRPGDVLVLNQTRVIPARLPAIKAGTGGKAEILLLKKLDELRWLGLVGGKNIKLGAGLILEGGGVRLEAVVEAEGSEMERVLRFSAPLEPHLKQLGQIPLPPYIHNPDLDPERYQTIYSRVEGSAAAPTAGLHFTPDLLLRLKDRGVILAYCVLHIGLDTFAPVRVEDIHQHHIHRERAILRPEEAEVINRAKLAGGRIIAVGTTACRTLETAAWRSVAYETPANDPASIAQTIKNISGGACPWRPVLAIDEETDLYITPGYRYQAVDCLITNFHLPKSTLLMMISAFAGYENVMAAYRVALAENYRFFSLGDAMFIHQ